MKKRLLLIFRLVTLTSLVASQLFTATAFAAQPAGKQTALDPASKSAGTVIQTNAAPGPKPASKGYTILSQDTLKPHDMSAVSVNGPVVVNSAGQNASNPFSSLFKSSL